MTVIRNCVVCYGKLICPATGDEYSLTRGFWLINSKLMALGPILMRINLTTYVESKCSPYWAVTDVNTLDSNFNVSI